jgi:hypothetical protein
MVTVHTEAGKSGEWAMKTIVSLFGFRFNVFDPFIMGDFITAHRAFHRKRG